VVAAWHLVSILFQNDDMDWKWRSLMSSMIAVAVAFAASDCGRSVAQSAEPFRAVASVDEVMDSIVIPSSEVVFDAVVYSNGELIQAPKTDDDWFSLRIHALAVAEGGNLLLMPPRAKDTGDWSKFSRALTDAAVDVAAAAEAKDIERVLQTGSAMYTACTACHAKYIEDASN
jgi:hypothetical protein